MLNLVEYPEANFQTIIIKNEVEDSFWKWNRIEFVASSILATATIVELISPQPVYAFAITSATIFTFDAITILIEKLKKQQMESLNPNFLNCLTLDYSFRLRCLPGKIFTNFKQDECGDEGEIKNHFSLDLSLNSIWDDVYQKDKKNIQNPITLDKYSKGLSVVSIKKRKVLCDIWQKNVDNFIRFQVIQSRLNHLVPLFFLEKHDKINFKSNNLNKETLTLLYPPKNLEGTIDEQALYYSSSLIERIRDFAT